MNQRTFPRRSASKDPKQQQKKFGPNFRPKSWPQPLEYFEICVKNGVARFWLKIILLENPRRGRPTTPWSVEYWPRYAHLECQKCQNIGKKLYLGRKRRSSSPQIVIWKHLKKPINIKLWPTWPLPRKEMRQPATGCLQSRPARVLESGHRRPHSHSYLAPHWHLADASSALLVQAIKFTFIKEKRTEFKRIFATCFGVERRQRRPHKFKTTYT